MRSYKRIVPHHIKTKRLWINASCSVKCVSVGDELSFVRFVKPFVRFDASYLIFAGKLVIREVGNHDLNVSAGDLEAVDLVEDTFRRVWIDLEGNVQVSSLDR